MEIIGEILAVSQEKFRNSIDSARSSWPKTAKSFKDPAKDQDAVGLLFRNMHTIKGNARTYGLLNMTNTVHETEQVYDDLRKDEEKVWEPEAMLAPTGKSMPCWTSTARSTTSSWDAGRAVAAASRSSLMVEKDHVARALNLIKSAKAADAEAMKAALVEVDQTLRT